MLTFKQASRKERPFEDVIRVEYEITHSSKTKKTTLSEPMILEIRDGSQQWGPDKKAVTASITIEDCQADSAEEALDKLAGWLSRLAAGIRERTPGSQNITIYRRRY